MKVINEDSNKLVFEVTGEGHTICNILRKRLMAKDEVTAAAYDITHPLVGQPEFEVHGENPRESIIEASEQIKEEANQFKEILTKELQ